jgi:hypothetical protein
MSGRRRPSAMENSEPPQPPRRSTDQRIIFRRGRYLDGLLRQNTGLRTSAADQLTVPWFLLRAHLECAARADAHQVHRRTAKLASRPAEGLSDNNATPLADPGLITRRVRCGRGHRRGHAHQNHPAPGTPGPSAGGLALHGISALTGLPPTVQIGHWWRCTGSAIGAFRWLVPPEYPRRRRHRVHRGGPHARRR